MKDPLTALVSLFFCIANVTTAALHAHVMPGRPDGLQLRVDLTEVAHQRYLSNPPPATAPIRAVLNTGPPPINLATGTAIWAGQSSAVRFTAPSDVPGYGARLMEVQIVLRASTYARSALTLSIVEDSGRNSPGAVVLETRTVSIPAYDGRVTVTASSPGNLYLYPGEIFWIVLDGNAGYVQNAPSWLDSANGVAWTAFNVWNANGEDNRDEQVVMNKGTEMWGDWVVERSRSASSVRVLVQ
ncbi:hypothetical protein HDU98_012337 [Podochytrium sp. JEL0797]|nr:hypothetical protein HDU98_012337 [Podochytrium sp. JEL0797]